jgi:alkaline phosphatase
MPVTGRAVEPGKRAGDAAATSDDPLRALQLQAMEQGEADFAHWGGRPAIYSDWTSHSNRLVPVYTFGLNLDSLRNAGSAYRDPARLEQLYGSVPQATLNPTAEYFDQTAILRLQEEAVAAGKRHIILMVFDGMDWQTTRAAAIYRTGQVGYAGGEGSGLAFQDVKQDVCDFGYVVTSPRLGGLKTDVDAQITLGGDQPPTGGYDAAIGGPAPWSAPTDPQYLMGKLRSRPHTVTDSAASATSMTSGIKTYNGAINVTVDGTQVEPLARRLQRDQGRSIGLVSSVPISHATPAAAYANNVSRNDYQDLTRDLLGLPSAAHRREPLAGVEVLLGGGWGETKTSDGGQGRNYVAGNRYLSPLDAEQLAVEQGGRYVVAERTAGQRGHDVLQAATEQAVASGDRLFGFFGVGGGHLPFQTADGDFDPTLDAKGDEDYSQADIDENPSLAQMTTAALQVLEKDPDGFWLMVEAGDVDWANHANNIDSTIGAVLSGEAAFQAVVDWVDARQGWDETAIIVTADHGHYLVLDDPSAVAATSPR